MEDKLVECLEKFESSFVDYTKKRKSDFSLKSDYIELKYEIVKLFLSAVNETIDFDFDTFVEKQKSLPLLKEELSRRGKK
tara:strand:+ start:425 stop:664 length:240 start_codon:yes stop_codon:yes gene_type:complete